MSVAPIVASTPDSGAPYALGGVLESEHLTPESEVDADIGEHRPCERGCGREDHRSPHDKNDGEEQGEKPGDADQDALIEREAGRLVLERVRLPQIELRERRRAQFGHIGHRGSRIERQAKNVRLGIVVAFGRRPLAGGDGSDSRGAEIGPDDARADETKMRRHDEARQLLVGIVGKREDDPGRLRPRLERADFDAPHNAVCAWRGRDLDPVALGAVMLDGPGEVDCVGVSRHPDGLNRERRPASQDDEGQQNRDANECRQDLSLGSGVAGWSARAPGADGGLRSGAQVSLRQGCAPPAASARRRRPGRKAHDRATRRQS